MDTTQSPICDNFTGDCRCNATDGKDVIPRPVAVMIEADRAALLSALRTANVFLELFNDQIEVSADVRRDGSDEVLASVTLEAAHAAAREAIDNAKKLDGELLS